MLESMSEERVKNIPAPSEPVFTDVVCLVGKKHGGFLGYLRRLPDVEIGGETHSRYSYSNRIEHALIFSGMPTEDVQAMIREMCLQFAIPVRIHFRTLGQIAASRTPKPKFKR